MSPLLDNFFNRQILAQYGPSVLAGFWVTVEVALLTIVVGVGLGLALAVVRAMRVRAADIAIIGIAQGDEPLPQFHVWPLASYPFQLICPHDHPLATARRITLPTTSVSLTAKAIPTVNAT